MRDLTLKSISYPQTIVKNGFAFFIVRTPKAKIKANRLLSLYPRFLSLVVFLPPQNGFTF